MLQTNNARYKYTPDEMSQDDFLTRFVVRGEIFDEIFDELKEADYNVPNQHYIIIGQRGQGKTTLLRKLKLEVEKDKKLFKFLIPVKFSEEQYRVRQLCRLWEEVADYLQSYHDDIFNGVLDEIELHLEDDNYNVKCFSYLEKVLKKSKKKLLLLIDNIDELLGKLKEQEQQQLREILLTSSSFIIVGGSTKMFEQQYDYSKPFYEFFKIIQLEALNYEESIALLKAIGNEEQTKKIEKIINDTPERIETLRRVTGGVPRTIVMLFDIFIEDNGDAFDDLMKILDEVTPLYKHRMDDLPPVLQEIVDTIALNWDGMLTKDIAKRTRLESKVVSAQLKQLEKYQIVESESVGKNKIYKIKERFFNIWYLMRFGRKKDRSRVEWLVKFLLSWYDRDELEKKAKSFIKTVMKQNPHSAYALHMCEALGYTAIDERIKYEMKQETRQYLTKVNKKLVDEITESDLEIIEKVMQYIEEDRLKKALDNLKKIKKITPRMHNIYGNIYLKLEDLDKAVNHYSDALKGGINGVLLNLGTIYARQKNYHKAEKFYLEALENNVDGTLINLGLIYKKQKNYHKAEEYYLRALENGDKRVFFYLGDIFEDQKNYHKAEECYLKAVENDVDNALKTIIAFYKGRQDYIKAEKYCLKAIENDVDNALINLGIIYEEQKEYIKAKEYYFKAIESGDNAALLNLGIMYEEQKEYIKAEEYYHKAVKSGLDYALFLLGSVYEEQKEYLKAKEYYLKSIESGENAARNSLAWLYFEMVEDLENSLKIANKAYEVKKDFLNTHTLAVVELWAEKFSKSYEKFMEWLSHEYALDNESDVILYLNLLMAKGQLYKTKEFFEMEEYQLKERFKPLWYALMTLMKDEFPNEIKKMGSELNQTVNEVLEEIEKLKEKYALN